MSERECRWLLDEINNRAARVFAPYTEAILRAVLNFLLRSRAIQTPPPTGTAAIRALSPKTPPKRIGDGRYLVGGFAILTSDPLGEEPDGDG